MKNTIPHFDERTLAIIEQVRACRRPGQKVFLVGGAVRDALLGRSLKDLDFVTSSDSGKLARCAARALKGGVFTLDDERQSARVILKAGEGQSLLIDFVLMTGGSLSEDLKHRDFTVNAMAVGIDELGHLIDPLNGAGSLEDNELRVADETAIECDPLRSLRAVRLSKAYGFKISPQTRELITRNLAGLDRVARERVRDEVFKLLEFADVRDSLRQLEALGLLEPVFPAIKQLRNNQQSQATAGELWQHALMAVEYLETLLSWVVGGAADQIKSHHLLRAVEQLSPWREGIKLLLEERFQPDRSRVCLLYLGGLHQVLASHEVTQKQNDEFNPHQRSKAGVIVPGFQLALSTAEIDYLNKLACFRTRLHTLAQNVMRISDREIYRYFEDLGPAGVDLALLSLVDFLASRGEKADEVSWQVEVAAASRMIKAWFEERERVIEPPKLVDGYELQKELDLKPGKFLGELMAVIREEQASGLLVTHEDVLSFAREYTAQRRKES